MHFINIDPACVNYSTTNLVNPSNNLYFSFNYSHIFNRIRNNILSSRIGCKRKLSLNGKTVTWDMWENAYNWDNENVCNLHHCITYEHINPSTTDKMRNHLATEVLNESRLNLIKSYKESLGENGNCLDSTIKLLENINKLIDVFRYARPINELGDRRLYKIKFVHTFFKSWEQEATIPVNLMSRETKQNFDSVLLPFVNLNEKIIHRIGSG